MRAFKVPTKEKLIIEDSRKMQRRITQPSNLHGHYWKSLLPHLKRYEKDPISWTLINVAADRFDPDPWEDDYEDDDEVVPLISSSSDSWGDYNTETALFETPFKGVTVRVSFDELSGRKSISVLENGKKIFSTHSTQPSISTSDTPLTPREMNHYRESLNKSIDTMKSQQEQVQMAIFNKISAAIMEANRPSDLKELFDLFSDDIGSYDLNYLSFYDFDEDRSAMLQLDTWSDEYEDLKIRLQQDYNLPDFVIKNALNTYKMFVIAFPGKREKIIGIHTPFGWRAKVFGGPENGLMYIQEIGDTSPSKIMADDPMLHSAKSWNDITQITKMHGMQDFFIPEEDSDSDWG